MNWQHPEGYTIRIKLNDGSAIERNGIFLYKRKGGGIAWIETGYLDPWNAGHTMHEQEGDIEEGPDWITVRGKDRTVFIGYAEDGDTRAGFDRLAKEKKATFRSERARLKKDLGSLISH